MLSCSGRDNEVKGWTAIKFDKKRERGEVVQEDKSFFAEDVRQALQTHESL